MSAPWTVWSKKPKMSVNHVSRWLAFGWVR
jgi:hypothetical protein